jgi:zinc protease
LITGKVKMMFKKILILLFTFVSAGLFSLASPDTTNQLVPEDPSIHRGTLKNGLNWYIAPNDLPKNRAELRLIVRAGSVLEREDQRGLAHFLEHMAFNGTREYSENKLIDYLQSLGMEFGPDINAHTSFDETVYQLTVDTQKSGELDQALNVLEEWAFNIVLTEKEIDKERPVILEERRMGRDATMRMTEKSFPVIFHNSLYGERLPIGLPEIIESAPLKAFQDFYDDWYRPDLMSVLIVGDVNVQEAKNLIEEHFGSYRTPPGSPVRPSVAVPDHGGPLFSIQTDPEATTASLEIINKFSPVVTNSPQAWDRYFREQLFSIMFNARITEKLQQRDPAFIAGYSSMAGYSRDKHLFQWGVMTAPGEMQRGFRSYWTEVERVRRYGFTQEELDRAGKQLAAGYEYMLKEKLSSETLVSIISSAITTGDSITPLEWEYDQLKSLLARVTPAEVREVGNPWFTSDNRVISFMGSGQAPTEQQIQQVMIEIKEADLAPYEQGKVFSSLMDQLPKPGTIVSKEYDREGDFYTWTLSNGAKMVLKKTDFKENEILFKAQSPGGVSLLPDSDLISAALASTAVNQSGLGMMTSTELQQFLAGKTISLSPSIGDQWEYMNGYAVPQDLEYLFQLIYLYFNAPLYQSSGWEAYKDRLSAFLSEQEKDPMELYSRMLNETVYMGHPRAKMLTLETLKEMNYDRAYDIFRQRFFDGDDFTFYFVGALDFDVMEELAETYLASLISIEGNENWEDRGLRYNKSAMTRTLEAGIDEQSRVTLIYAGDMTGEKAWSYERAYTLSALADSLENRLLEVIREEYSGVYSVSVSSQTHLIPAPEYSFSISFSCDPDRIEELINLITGEIDGFQGEEDLTVYAADTREARLRGYDENLQNNGWYLSSLSYFLSRGLPTSLMYTGEEMARKITPEKIRKTAQDYLHHESRQTVILVPEQKPE